MWSLALKLSNDPSSKTIQGGAFEDSIGENERREQYQFLSTAALLNEDLMKCSFPSCQMVRCTGFFFPIQSPDTCSCSTHTSLSPDVLLVPSFVTWKSFSQACQNQDVHYLVKMNQCFCIFLSSFSSSPDTPCLFSVLLFFTRTQEERREKRKRIARSTPLVSISCTFC